ncbi:MAG: RNA polymerase sigma factor [Candidatus Paceibacterota bacterium]|jgi:RNA polymerase sigma-70 factor (ECF subfamily)
MNTDQELIDSFILHNDRDSLKELILKYTPQIYNFTRHFVGVNEADDITQDVFIKVWKNLRKFDSEKASFKTWIFTIAKNTATDFLRKRKSILFSDIQINEEDESFSENIPDENLLPDEALQKLQDSILLNKILEKLPIHYKTILILHYQEEMTFDEIGKILNKPLNTVKSYHHRAILELRKMLY